MYRAAHSVRERMNSPQSSNIGLLESHLHGIILLWANIRSVAVCLLLILVSPRKKLGVGPGDKTKSIPLLDCPIVKICGCGWYVSVEHAAGQLVFDFFFCSLSNVGRTHH